MPISDYRPAGINARDISDVVTPYTPPPAIGSFMDAFRQGFITTEDITKRIKDKPLEDSDRRLNLQANDVKSRQLDQVKEMQPGDLVLGRLKQELDIRKQKYLGGELEIAEGSLPVRKTAAVREAEHADAIMSGDPTRIAKAVQKQNDEALLDQYVKLVGSAPDVISSNKPGVAEPFSTWFAKNGAKEADAALTQVEADAATNNELAKTNPTQLTFTPEAVAQEVRRRQTGFHEDAQRRYDEYKADVESKPQSFAIGTPGYYKEISRKLDEAVKQRDLYGVKLKAAPGILEKNAEAARGPTAASLKSEPSVRFNDATGMEDKYQVFIDPTTGEIVSETLLSSNRPSQTENQSNAHMYSSRLKENREIMSSLEASGFNPASYTSTIQGWDFYPNRLKSGEFQSFESAKQNWIAAVLRRESGAAIAKTEYVNASKQYFARDGDTPEVVAQKGALRRKVEKSMREIVGPQKAEAENFLNTVRNSLQGPLPTSAIAAPKTKRVVQNGLTFEWNGSTYIPVSTP